MNAFGFGVRSLFRDLRGGELTVLLSAVVLAVAAMTAVGFFTDRVAQAIRAQAGAVLAGDLELRSASPIDTQYIDDARRAGLQVAEVVAFPTMALAGESNSLVYVRAVTGNYPLRGEVLVADELFGPKYTAHGIPQPGTAWAEPGLLGRMNVDVGTVLSVGSARLQITRVLEYQPGQTMGGMAALAPGLLINRADLQRLDVIRPGSRVTYRQLFAGPPAAIEQFRSSLKDRLDDGVRMRGLEDAGAQINAAIDRAQRFLTLASLVTVILAAVATAMAARRYALRHLDNVALLKSLGATQGFIQHSTLTQLLAVVIVTAMIGTAIGYGAQQALALLSSELLKVQLPP
ncbi:MAG TPA: FtsX-like permease family protein, partial [Chromatiales bacterium]|nr:FtsX-like permease family protein [Chromatiales bacterium]